MKHHFFIIIVTVWFSVMLGGGSTETCGGASCVRTAYNFLSLCNWKTMKTMTITNIKIHIHFIVPFDTTYKAVKKLAKSWESTMDSSSRRGNNLWRGITYTFNDFLIKTASSTENAVNSASSFFYNWTALFTYKFNWRSQGLSKTDENIIIPMLLFNILNLHNSIMHIAQNFHCIRL